VSAPVVPVVAEGRSLIPPADPSQLGWWIGSAPAGSSTGSTILIGHVDSARSGPGALYQVGLGHLKPGDPITTQTAAGVTFTYRVYAQQIIVKSHGLPDTIFTSSGPPRLVIITCGGPFDRADGNYLDNVVVFAAPTSQQQ
jgi:hypothetical protein